MEEISIEDERKAIQEAYREEEVASLMASGMSEDEARFRVETGREPTDFDRAIGFNYIPYQTEEFTEEENQALEIMNNPDREQIVANMSEEERRNFTALEQSVKNKELYNQSIDLQKEMNDIDRAEFDAGIPMWDKDTIEINGVERAVTNSSGKKIAHSEKSLRMFYEWFGDSKVVDEQGRPLVVYHGTRQGGFTVFEPQNIMTKSEGIGNFFVSKKEIAETYGDNTYPVYLNLKNPLIVDYRGKFYYEPITVDGKIMGKDTGYAYNSVPSITDVARYARDNGYDGVIAKNIKDTANEMKIIGSPDEKRRKELKRLSDEELFAEYRKVDKNQPDDISGFFKHFGKRRGRDYMAGIIEQSERYARNESRLIADDYVAFSPNQIKSTSNTGTFSKSNDDIRYQTVLAKKTDVTTETDPKKMRDAAKNYLRDVVRKQDITHPKLGKIRVSNVGIKEFLHYTGNLDKLALVPHLKELIETSEVGEKEDLKHPRKDNIVAFYPLYNDAYIDGKPYDITTKIGVDNKGNLFYTVLMDDKNSLQEGESETKSGAIEEAININITPSGRDVNSPRYQIQEYDEQLEADLAEFDKILDSFAEENKEYYSKKGKFEDAKKIQKKYKDFFMYNIADASVSTALHDPFYFEYDGQKDITNIWIPKKLEKNSNIILYRYAEQISIPVNKFEKSKFKKLGFKRQKLYDEGMRDIYTLNKEEKSDDAKDFVRENGKYIRKPSAYYQTAYAGSRVDYDKPSLEAIGTGEGQQAHGWGLYYALSRDVAEGYRETFMSDDYNTFWKIDGVPLKEFLGDLHNQETFDLLDNVKNKVQSKNAQDARDNLLHSLYDISRMFHKKYKDGRQNIFTKEVYHNPEDLRLAELAEEKRDFVASLRVDDITIDQGQVHEVDIPENPYLLDEQKPFSEQSDIVKKGIIDTLNSMSLTEKQKEKFRNNIENRRDTGKEIYDELVVAMGTSKGDGLISSSKENMPLVSKALSENGVKGITYEGRQDGRCFVIFNPKDVKVIQKFYQIQAEGGINLEVGGGRKTIKPYKRNPLKVLGQYEPTKKMITLFKGRNPTTLIHEMGHHYLPIQLRLLEKAGKWDKLKPLYKELGISSVENMNRDAEEKLIDMFTSYIFYNEAPNVETQSIFERAKQWMISAYNTVKNFVKPSEEVTKFFDELIAGEENAPDVSHKNKNRSFYERFFAKIMYIYFLKVPTNSILFIYTIFSSFRCCNYTGKSGPPSRR